MTITALLLDCIAAEPWPAECSIAMPNTPNVFAQCSDNTMPKLVMQRQLFPVHLSAL